MVSWNEIEKQEQSQRERTASWQDFKHWILDPCQREKVQGSNAVCQISADISPAVVSYCLGFMCVNNGLWLEATVQILNKALSLILTQAFCKERSLLKFPESNENGLLPQYEPKLCALFTWWDWSRVSHQPASISMNIPFHAHSVSHHTSMVFMLCSLAFQTKAAWKQMTRSKNLFQWKIQGQKNCVRV